MFTGIIEELGRVVALENRDAGARLTVTCSSVLADATLGASIAVNGACLTAVSITGTGFSADLAPETLRRTNLGDLRPGCPVNLERPLRVNSRIDGHFVLGHVDGTSRILSLQPLGDDNWWLEIAISGELSRYVVSKGSVAVDGISLTVAATREPSDADAVAAFTIIPHTFEHTTLHAYEPGARVNIEVDILAKHIEKLLSHAETAARTEPV